MFALRVLALGLEEGKGEGAHRCSRGPLHLHASVRWRGEGEEERVGEGKFRPGNLLVDVDRCLVAALSFLLFFYLFVYALLSRLSAVRLFGSSLWLLFCVCYVCLAVPFSFGVSVRRVLGVWLRRFLLSLFAETEFLSDCVGRDGVRLGQRFVCVYVCVYAFIYVCMCVSRTLRGLLSKVVPAFCNTCTIARTHVHPETCVSARASAQLPSHRIVSAFPRWRRRGPAGAAADARTERGLSRARASSPAGHRREEKWGARLQGGRGGARATRRFVGRKQVGGPLSVPQGKVKQGKRMACPSCPSGCVREGSLRPRERGELLGFPAALASPPPLRLIAVGRVHARSTLAVFGGRAAAVGKADMRSEDDEERKERGEERRGGEGEGGASW